MVSFFSNIIPKCLLGFAIIPSISYQRWMWIKFKWLPFWAPCCNLTTVLTPLKQIRTCQQTIYSTLHRHFTLWTVLYNILKSVSHFPMNFFELKTEIWIWYLWEKICLSTIPSHDRNWIGDGWNTIFKSVSMRKPGRIRQEVIQLKSPISLKLGSNVGFGK